MKLQAKASSVSAEKPAPARPPGPTKINWITTTALLFLHAGSIAAFWFIDTKAIIVAITLNFMCLSWGIGMGYHRLLTHRAYQVPKWIEYVLSVFGTLTLEGGPIFWVGTHRIHHQYSEMPEDPHSPRDGAYWAHMGWITCEIGRASCRERV